MVEELWLLELVCPQADYDRLVGLIASEIPYGWEEDTAKAGEIVFRIHGRDKKKLASLGILAQEICPDSSHELTEVEKKDWARAWRQFFTPVLCGSRFVVLPPWLADRHYKGRIPVLIDPANAFGTGHHATTALCLTALSNLLEEGRLRRGQWFLDIGCGSGILSIAAEKAGLNGTALDIDEDAIANARDNRELNEADGLEIITGSVEKVKGDTYDLVMANIIAGPLMEMAPKITALLKKDGILVLSGILEKQMQDVIRAYMACGLREPENLQAGEWVAIVWK